MISCEKHLFKLLRTDLVTKDRVRALQASNYWKTTIPYFVRKDHEEMINAENLKYV